MENIAAEPAGHVGGFTYDVEVRHVARLHCDGDRAQSEQDTPPHDKGPDGRPSGPCLFCGLDDEEIVGGNCGCRYGGRPIEIDLPDFHLGRATRTVGIVEQALAFDPPDEPVFRRRRLARI